MHIRILNEAMDHYGSISKNEYGRKVCNLTNEYIDLKTDHETSMFLEALIGNVETASFDNGVLCGLILAKSLHYILNEPEKAFNDLFGSYGNFEEVYKQEIETVEKLKAEKLQKE